MGTVLSTALAGATTLRLSGFRSTVLCDAKDALWY